MISKELNWNKFDWSDFQTLIIRIAENLFPDCYFEDYLKQGDKQDGIDLKSFLKKDGSFITIQCKREQKLFPYDLDNIVGELSQEMKEKSSQFLVATSASLQTKKLQEKVDYYKLNLPKVNNIHFDCWDIHFIETHLKNYWNLVAYYFSEQEADLFCYPQLKNTCFSNIKPIADYIPRKATKFFYDEAKRKIQEWSFVKMKTVDLLEEILKDPLDTKRICLLGDAYQGKSTYLHQVALLLKESRKRKQPLLIELKNWNALSLDELLTNLYGSWKNIPLKDLILIIDGLDEVPTDKFGEMVGHIKLFTEAYAPVSIVFSCRKLFYNHYDVGTTLDNFDAYELYPLQYEDINYYLQNKLGPLFNQFRNESEQRGIHSVLYHPFFLVQIAEKFLTPPHRLPESKIQVIDDFIEDTFKLTTKRKTTGSETVKHDTHSFHELVRRMAFALQYAGVNGFDDVTMQQIFSKKERNLLQHSSLVSVSGNIWSFTNALFQEHLAARLMADMNLNDILSITTIGKGRCKIKTKWVQTIASLLSIIEQNHPLYHGLLNFVEKDNIELIFQTEPSKYTASFKFEVFKKLVDKCIALNIRPMLTYEDTIGRFVADNKQCVNYTFNCLERPEIPNRVKTVCCRILRAVRIPSSLQDLFVEILKSQIVLNNDAEYIGNLIDVLAKNKIGNAELVIYLVGLKKFETAHPYRDSVYELIMVLDMAERFYHYPLTGFKALRQYNSGISHGGSEHNLQNLLLQTNNRQQLGLLLQEMQTPDWVEFFRYKTGNEGFIHNLFQKLVKVFDKDPRIIIPIAQYIKVLGKQYIRDEYEEIDKFLDATNSHWLVVRLLVDGMFKENDWEFGGLITTDSYDYVLFEYEKGNYEPGILWSLSMGLQRRKKEEVADVFMELCEAATEGMIINKGQHDVYQRNIEEKKKNDLRVIQSPVAFKKGLIDFFGSFGKRTISEDDLYIDFDEKPQFRNVNSDFIYRFILQLRRSNRIIRLHDCLRKIDDLRFFADFRAEEILNYSAQNEAAKETFETILRDYYTTEITKANFVNCKWYDEHYYEREREVRLGKIFEKYRFFTEDKYLIQMLWLDSGGIYNYLNSKSNHRQCLTELILESLTPVGKVDLTNQVIQNMSAGIANEGVLGNHVGLCKQLMITEAKDIVLQIIKQNIYSNLHLTGYVDVYMEIGGEKDELLSIFISYANHEDYLYFHLVRVLMKDYPQLIIETLLQRLKRSETPLESKILLSRYLAHLGNAEGFNFLVEQINLTKKCPLELESGWTAQKVETRRALHELDKVMYLVVDKEYKDDSHLSGSAKNVILEWLHAFAAKSEEDLEMVLEFLSETLEKAKGSHPDAMDLNWYMNRMVENFRDIDKEPKTVRQIKEALKEYGIAKIA